MSSDAVGWAIGHSPYKGTTYAVHVMIADTVNDQNDNEFFMAIGKLAKKARCSRGTASEAVGRLVVGGFLLCLDPDAATGKPIPYRFLFPDVPVVYESRGVRRTRTPRTAEVSGERAGGDRPADTGCSENAQGVSGDRTQTQEELQVEPNEEPNSPAVGGEEEALELRSRAIVQAHWDRCKQVARPTPTLSGGKGNPFMALVGVCSNLLLAGWQDGQVANALWHTSTYTRNAMTFELNRRFPHGSTRDGDAMTPAQRAIADHRARRTS